MSNKKAIVCSAVGLILISISIAIAMHKNLYISNEDIYSSSFKIALYRNGTMGTAYMFVVNQNGDGMIETYLGRRKDDSINQPDFLYEIYEQDKIMLTTSQLRTLINLANKIEKRYEELEYRRYLSDFAINSIFYYNDEVNSLNFDFAPTKHLPNIVNKLLAYTNKTYGDLEAILLYTSYGEWSLIERYEPYYFEKLGIPRFARFQYLYSDMLKLIGKPNETFINDGITEAVYDDFIITLWNHHPEPVMVSVIVTSAAHRFGENSIGIGSSKEMVAKAYSSSYLATDDLYAYFDGSIHVEFFFSDDDLVELIEFYIY